jgi:hypothetical protein
MALAMFTLEMALLAWLLLLLTVAGGRGQPGSGELRGEPGEFLKTEQRFNLNAADSILVLFRITG